MTFEDYYNGRLPSYRTTISSILGDTLVYIKYFGIQFPVLIVSGALYVLVIRELRSGTQNKRKSRLAVLICLLWILWTVLTVPFSCYELYQTIKQRPGMVTLLSRFDSSRGPSEDSVLGYHLYAFLLEIVLFTVKQSFSFFNSVLLLVMVRPFFEPIISFKKHLQHFRKKTLSE